MMEPCTVTRDQADSLAGLLARAFYNDPVTTWMYPDDGSRVKRSKAMFASLMRSTVRSGLALTTRATQGVALWEFMERGPASMLRQWPAAMRMIPLLGTRTPLVFCGMARVAGRHPDFPHWYLTALGTDPASQGRGVGSRLMVSALDRCDDEEQCAYLEASGRKNIPFYQRHGFAVTGEIALPRGPTIYPMLRKPRSRQ